MIPKTTNPPGYTAERYMEDLQAVLPFALPELRKIDRLTTCAQCGVMENALNFVFHHIKDGLEVAVVCNTCIEKGLLPPHQWQHADDASGMFVAREHWAAFAKVLRYFGAWALREELGFPLIAKSLHADDIPDPSCTGIAFFETTPATGNRFLEALCWFQWQPHDRTYAGGGELRTALHAALTSSALMKRLGAKAGMPKPGPGDMS
ncbi:hypothetical protein [Cupriavidus taiwanensis]|uniref:hypothetical protein n=1 Tax=Cupriavidus taiwanensis TaxID=164546 RepID=UPI000E1A6531|nr:hypothetical protein [Cupriavidus taiwanensis]SPA46772.1 hypothetical protein CBM2629_A70002 [Cupriavidus taiwanensis]